MRGIKRDCACGHCAYGAQTLSTYTHMQHTQQLHTQQLANPAESMRGGRRQRSGLHIGRVFFLIRRGVLIFIFQALSRAAHVDTPYAPFQTARTHKPAREGDMHSERTYRSTNGGRKTTRCSGASR